MPKTEPIGLQPQESKEPSLDGMTVVVTGANGEVGSIVTEELLSRGCRVRAAARRRGGPHALAAGAVACGCAALSVLAAPPHPTSRRLSLAPRASSVSVAHAPACVCASGRGAARGPAGLSRFNSVRLCARTTPPNPLPALSRPANETRSACRRAQGGGSPGATPLCIEPVH